MKILARHLTITDKLATKSKLFKYGYDYEEIKFLSMTQPISGLYKIVVYPRKGPILHLTGNEIIQVKERINAQVP